MEIRAGFRIVSTIATDSRREYKRRWAKAAYDREKAEGPPRRKYVRHPPGVRVVHRASPEKERATRKRYAKNKRARDRRAREEAERMKKTERECFLARLERAELATAAKMICCGRAVLDDANREDVGALFDGEDPHEVAARIDFAVYLRHPLRGWTAESIARLFGRTKCRVEKWLATRTKFAVVDEG